MAKEVLIIGSSEGTRQPTNYVGEMQRLMNDEFRNRRIEYYCERWDNDGVWENGTVTLESLLHKAQQYKKGNGFVIAMFTPDDLLETRSESFFCSRDNVWLEYGLFIGIIGRQNVFMVCPAKKVTKEGETRDWHKPSDISGYQKTYEYKDNVDDISDKLKIIAQEIVTRIDNQTKSPPPQDTSFTNVRISFDPSI